MEQNQIESEWIEKVRSGDAGAFENLFRRYCQLLTNFARRYVQDVFLKIWLNRSNLNPNSNIKSYLFTAVRNQALKHIRHVKIELDSDENIKSFNLHIKTPEDKLGEKELSTAVHKAIEELPESRRHIFKMSRYFRDYRINNEYEI